MYDGLKDMAKYYTLATGINMTADDLLIAGERINNIKKAFNIREGWQRSDDWLPPRLFSEPISEGEGEGTVISQEALKLMIDDYYKARGWTDEGLIPDDKMRALELEGSTTSLGGLQYGTQVYSL